ncbi:lytic murein transglycosylase [Aliiglaciecola sp. LCG003]|uniref:lytic murein transglycosylase n=1 Tax=Aliiglaciecola sp. LCG003 TaxID=3053655 RepID=UPI002573DBBC|nr:lytic murein transglycosylase [Aliiglaciecola sp. LCG003]WJG08672.1 lytic murein transglycosylase [Aliiglaciecola sp. LCG003]
MSEKCAIHLALIASITLVTAPSIAAQNEPAEANTGQEKPSFAQCINGIQTMATQAGIADEFIKRALDDVQHIDKALEYDRNQPEFVQTFPNYLNKRVTQWRIDKGRQMLRKHATLLSDLTQRFGVPAHYLIAFWGLETNFGGIKGKMSTIDSLATLACDPRRSGFFTEELITAMRLMERENLAKSKMIGSWAGAMGHTQFMPSAYINYAMDGDEDGVVDLWDSEEDALTSAANFLSKLGWQAGFIWGREVLLPENFDYSHAGKDNRLSLSEWSTKGIHKADNKRLPESDIQASLLVPTGANGPAFLVYKNFDVIMRWNNSESYAIAVGYLADKLIGKSDWVTALPDLPTYPIAKMVVLQENLNQLGFDVGKPDGIVGPATRRGIRNFQKSVDLVADGYPGEHVFDALQQVLAQKTL